MVVAEATVHQMVVVMELLPVATVEVVEEVVMEAVVAIPTGQFPAIDRSILCDVVTNNYLRGSNGYSNGGSNGYSGGGSYGGGGAGYGGAGGDRMSNLGDDLKKPNWGTFRNHFLP